MRRAFGVAAASVVVALAWSATAFAGAAHDAALARRGIAHALRQHWLKPPDASRYRQLVDRAVWDARRLPPLRGDAVEAQLAQLTPLWDSYTSPRALALFSQLQTNLAYLETHRVPAPKTDVAGDDGVVYRWFAGDGFEFHPLASFGALNDAAAAQDVEATRTLADALLARAIPRGRRLLWEYAFRFGGGYPPWASGMAQSVASQALARSSVLLQDPSLLAAAARAYAAVPPLTLALPSGPWIRLYGFDREIVLNAQLQAILSLTEYAQVAGDASAAALAQRMTVAVETLFPRFDTGDWSLYELGGAYAPLEYENYVTQELATLAARTQDPFWAAAAARFRAYLGPPQVTEGTPPPTLYPQPQDGFLDSASIPITLSQRASLTVSIGSRVLAYRLGRGAHVLTWTPPPTLAPGTYPVTVSAVSHSGIRATVQLAPVAIAWDTAPPSFPQPPTLQGTTLAWQADDPGTPWLHLVVELVDPSGANPPQTVDLGREPVSGSAQLPLPPGTWQASLQATNSAGQTATVDLGTAGG